MLLGPKRTVASQHRPEDLTSRAVDSSRPLRLLWVNLSHAAEPDTTSEWFIYARFDCLRRPASTPIGSAVVEKGCDSASALMEDAQLRAPRIGTFNATHDGGNWASGSAEALFLLLQDP
jgi:hypothetical protein